MRPAHAAAASCAVVPPFKKPLVETGGDVREEAQGEGEGEETGVKERWTATRGAATSFGAFNERPFIVPRSSFKLFLRGLGRGSYPAHVTVYPYNGYIKSTNPIVRHVMSLTWTMKRMRANQRTPKHAATQPLHGSNTRARAPKLVTS